MFRDSACQVGPELPLDKSRNRPLTRLLPGKESFKLFGDDLIQHRRFRIARAVGLVSSHEGTG